MEAIIKNFKLITLILVGACLALAYPLSIVFMNHGITAEIMHHSPMNGQSIISELPMEESNACVNFHLDLFQKLSQSSPVLYSTLTALVLLATVFLASIFCELNPDKTNKRIHFQYQRLRHVSLAAFMAQIGFWLATIEKKAPAYAFATA